MSRDEVTKLEHELAVLQRGYQRLRSEIAESHERAVMFERLAEIQRSFNKIFEASLQHIPLHDALTKTLDIILDIRWLALEKQGCIFLVDPHESERLRLSIHNNLDDSLVEMCDSVVFGHCLCGRAAQIRRTIFKDRIDDEHENMPAGMKPHGHYVVPIMAGPKLLGVLNLYAKHGHRPDPLEEQYLRSAAGVLSMIIKNKQYQQQLAELSFEDELTGLANRRLFAKELQRALSRAERTREKIVLLYLDLDRFKPVNDTHGHAVGDRLLQEVAKRIKSCLREMDVLARVGGDEFTVLLEMINDQEEIGRLRERIVEAIGQPFLIGGVRVEIDVSIGVSCYPDDGGTCEELTLKADQAMYKDKGTKTRGRMGAVAGRKGVR